MRRHMGMLLIYLAAIVAIVLGTPTVALACSCVVPGPPCQEAFRTDAIFTGIVLRIDASSRTLTDAPPQMFVPEIVVTLAVTDVFRGDLKLGSQVQVRTGKGGGDCGYGFGQGAEYIVYAGAGPLGLSTGICSRTAPIEQASEDLSFLRALRAGEPLTSRVFGTVRYLDESVEGRMTRVPFAGARVSLAADGQPAQTITTPVDGAFTFDAPPGAYQLRVHVPDGYYESRSIANVTLKDARACAVVDFNLRDDGHVSGRVVDAAERPVPNLAVTIGRPANGRVPVRWTSQAAPTDADGRYDLSQLSAGEYLVGIDVMTPSVEGAILVTVGQRAIVSGADLTVPELVRLVQLRGVVVDGDGRAVAGAKVYLRPADGSFRLIGPADVTGQDGRFTFAAQDGETYQLVAEGASGAPGRFDRGELLNVHASPGTPVLTIQLKTPRL